MIVSLPIKNSIKLKPFYDLGRKTLTDENDDYISKLMYEVNGEVLLEINKLLFTAEQNGFLPSFIELSLFDPQDQTAKRFYTILISDSDEKLNNYYVQMGCNIDEGSTILPNTIFYDSPYYFSKDLHGKKASQIKLGNLKAKIISFNTEPDTVKSFDDILDNVNRFKNRVIQEVFKNNKGKLALNTFLTIPIFRPAAPIENSIKHIYRGGAIMILGETKNDFDVNMFSNIFQNMLLKEIFKISHSELDIYRKKRNLFSLEMSLYHHFGRLNTIMNPLSEHNFGYDNLNEVQKLEIDYVKKSLLDVTTFMQSSLNTYSMYLKEECLFFFMREIDSVIKDDKMFEFKEVDFSLEMPESILNKKTSLAPFIFLLIANNFIQNSKRYFHDTPNKQIKISFRRENNLIRIVLYNNGTKIPQYILNKLGYKPTQSDSNSTGLGYYFTNLFLNISGAELQENGLFFSINNIHDGVELFFDYKIFEHE